MVGNRFFHFKFYYLGKQCLGLMYFRWVFFSMGSLHSSPVLSCLTSTDMGAMCFSRAGRQSVGPELGVRCRRSCENQEQLRGNDQSRLAPDRTVLVTVRVILEGDLAGPLIRRCSLFLHPLNLADL